MNIDFNETNQLEKVIDKLDAIEEDLKNFKGEEEDLERIIGELNKTITDLRKFGVGAMLVIQTLAEFL